MLSYMFHMGPGREDVGYLIRPIRSDSRLAFEQVFQICHNLGSSLLLHTFMSHSWGNNTLIPLSLELFKATVTVG